MREQEAPPVRLPVPEHSRIGQVIAVMSGKGGVGQSSVTALLAASLRRGGHRVGILDADITGPSIPHLVGVHERPEPFPGGILPPLTASGIPIMSIHLLLAHEDDPVIWRGPLMASAKKQFGNEVIWGALDFLLIDLPPGTGDAPLTVLQSLPVNGIIIVASPQDVVVMVIKKAIKMARSLGVPIIGLVENMSGFSCPHCHQLVPISGPSRAGLVCREQGLRFLGAVPLDPRLSALADQGAIEEYRVELFDQVPQLLQEMKGVGTA